MQLCILYNRISELSSELVVMSVRRTKYCDEIGLLPQNYNIIGLELASKYNIGVNSACP